MNRRELEDAADWDSLVRESEGDLPPDVPAGVLLRQYRADRARARERAHALKRLLVIIFIAAAFGTLVTCAMLPAQAHEAWINWGGYKGPDGTHCCGGSGSNPDCRPLLPDQVKATLQGYAVYLGTDGIVSEIVPYSEAQQSEDGEFWRCKRYDGSRRCFFAPQPGS